MSEIRGVVEGTFKDFGEFSELVKRVCAVVEESEPGTLAYEFFVDEANNKFLAYEVYANEQAFHNHNQNMAQFLGEIQQQVEFERARTLGEVTDPEVNGALQQMGFSQLSTVTGVRR